MLIGGSNNWRFSLFPDPVGHFGLSRQWGVAGFAGGDLSCQGYSTSQLVCTNLCLFKDNFIVKFPFNNKIEPGDPQDYLFNINLS